MLQRHECDAVRCAAVLRQVARQQFGIEAADGVDLRRGGGRGKRLLRIGDQARR
jgi:hypothetical protein